MTRETYNSSFNDVEDLRMQFEELRSQQQWKKIKPPGWTR